MKLGLNSPTAFYILGLIFGVFSITYFGMEVILEISPAVKSAILLLSSLTFFSATGLTASKWKNIPLYFLASASYLIFVIYTLLRFNFGSAGTFLILSGSSIIFLTAGYLVGEKDLKIPREKAKYLVAGGLILILGLFLFDLTGPQPETQLQLKESINVTDGQETTLGTLKVSNSFVLPRAFEVPEYEACTVGETPRVNIYTERQGGTVSGGQTLQILLKARFYGPEVELANETFERSYSVVRTQECVRKEGQLSVYRSEGLD